MTMTMSKANMKLLIFLALILSGCVSATVTEPRVCDVTSFSFPGNTSPSTQSFTFNVGFGKDFLTSGYLLNGNLTLNNDGDFSFLDEIMIGAADPNNGGEELTLWDSQHNSGTVLNVTASDTNLVNYIDSNGHITLNVTVRSQHPPASDWDLNAALCVSAELEKTYP